MFKFKKGQAAMEFLMTYGWAILVVLAAIGALAYFGVLSPDNLLPERTTFQAPISNSDNAYMTMKAGYLELEVPFTNNVGYDINVTELNPVVDVEVKGNPLTCNSTSVEINGQAVTDPIVVKNNDGFRYKWICGVGSTVIDKNNRIKGSLTFEYTNTYTEQVRLHTGSVNGKVA